MSAVIALDVGTVRVGCAWGDDTIKIPFPVATWKKEGGEAEREIIRTIREKSASVLVVGLPLNDAGEKTSMCEIAEKFARRLERRVEVKVEFIDESHSSIDGHEHQMMGVSRAGIDALAACEILRRYFAQQQ